MKEGVRRARLYPLPDTPDTPSASMLAMMAAAAVAHWGEGSRGCVAVNHRVMGSSPSWGAKPQVSNPTLIKSRQNAR